jgi:FAD/FMN-containing dehydrogenase
MTALAATAAYEKLAAAVRGDLTMPADPGYDQARAVYNAMIDKRPAAVVRCRDTADVITCVRFAQRGRLRDVGRCAGHRHVTAAQHHRQPRQPHRPRRRGMHLGDVDHATAAFGMATPSGIVASTGVAGLTLGGGIGYLSRRFGLTVDNLLAADVVLADGTFVTASQDSHGDLFWALRGGGGNFGVVTSFTFACHDIGEHGTIIGGPVFYDFAGTPEVLRWYRELLPSLPEELSGWFGLQQIPPAPPFPPELWGRMTAPSSGATPARTTGPARSSNRSEPTARRC